MQFPFPLSQSHPPLISLSPSLSPFCQVVPIFEFLKANEKLTMYVESLQAIVLMRLFQQVCFVALSLRLCPKLVFFLGP